ncbi:hypothetical protein [Aminipila sp.]|uniref:hypothetical protein n=1 Tax=Aminipila sp. TaxID=2060095 RepID=UPI00289CA287|nr:hypothetical protein [Aminipila sp.]
MNNNCSHYSPCCPSGLPFPLRPQVPQVPDLTILTGTGAPTNSIGSIGNVYIDLSTGNLYYKVQQPTPPGVRSIPSFTGTTHHVGIIQPDPYKTIQTAIDAATTQNGDILILDDPAYTTSTTITVTKSLTIQGHDPLNPAATTITMVAPGALVMMEITAPSVVLKDMKIVQPLIQSDNAVNIELNNHTATGYYINNCEISSCEVGIGVNVAEFQITGCTFTYAGVAGNNYRYISIHFTSGASIINGNSFVSASQDSACYFVAVTNLTGTITGKLLVSNNEQTIALFKLRHLFDMEEFNANDFQLFINNNTTISENNVPILLNAPALGIFRFIEVIGNHVMNSVGKGLIGIDVSYTGTTNIYASGNVLANPSFTAPWASATVPPSPDVGYRSSVMTNPSLPLATGYWLPLI